MLCSSCPAVAKLANGQNPTIPQPVLDFADAAVPHMHGENLLDNMGCSRVGDKVIAVVRVCDIPITSSQNDAVIQVDVQRVHIVPAGGGQA